MEELIQWLVILFFIISFLNSILKPKKTAQKRGPAESPERVITSGPTVEIPDIQTDLEEMIRQKIRTVQKKKETPKTEFDKRYSESKTFETRQQELSRVVQKKAQKQAVPEDKAKLITVESGSSMRKLLADPESARRAILLSEILGKPKALKRKW